MSETAAGPLPPPSRELSCKATIIGVGDTDYHLDYKTPRQWLTTSS